MQKSHIPAVFSFDKPSFAVTGQIAFDTQSGETKVFDGNNWNTVARPLNEKDMVFYKVSEIEAEKESGCYESTFK